jgi:hypothetical protein
MWVLIVCFHTNGGSKGKAIEQSDTNVDGLKSVFKTGFAKCP